MKIAFSEIHGSEISRQITDDGWFPHEELDLEVPVSGSLILRMKDEKTVAVAGRFTAGVKTICDRCGETAHIELATGFRYDCLVGRENPRTQHEVECRDEDFYRLYLEEPVIDTGEILREQLYLAIPAGILCRQSCRGLCQNCGTDLNHGECTCDASDSASVFAVLQKLKGR